MRLPSAFLAMGMSLAWTACAFEIQMDQTEDNRQYCAGMYSKSTWGGPIDPFILMKFITPPGLPEDSDPLVSVTIFEWRDRDLIGIPDEDGSGNRLGVCDDASVDKGFCEKSEIGKFILSPNATDISHTFIMSKAVNLKDVAPLSYNIKTTGYYCILTDAFTAENYEAIVEFRNAYGELPATQVPKLPFYGGMAILYTLMAGYWGFLYYTNRRDILAVQNYITAILVFLVIEMLLTWGFYEYQNRHGNTLGAKAFLIVVGILNAGRNSFSFFLLLIVCMGYGVVKETLGRTMVWVRWLAAAHFVFGLVYAITSLLVSPENAGPWVLFVVLPLAGTLTAFYVWTLNSLNFTLKDLRERKQHIKESMYRKLWWSILVSIVVIFAFFFFNSFSMASVNDPDFVPFHWKTRWFILDGWLNIVYFADVAWVAWIWRPTANNRRFAMSDEIAQDDDGNFEFGDIGVPGLSDDEDEEANVGKHATSQGQGATREEAGSATQTKANSQSVQRESMDGSTLFAVGEDGDRFSEDDSDEEHAKLVRK